MHDRVRLGFLGLGSWSDICAERIKGLDSVEICGCFTRNPEKKAAFAMARDCVPFESEAALMESDAIDVICVMTPNDLHHEQVLRAFEHGKDVFVDKPLTNTATEAYDLVHAAEEHGRILFTGHQTRRESRFRLMKREMEAGTVGTPVMAHINYTSEAGLGQSLGGWRYDPERTPAVGLVQIGVHAIDVLHYFFGPAMRVQAWLGGAAGAEHGLVNDACVAMLHFENGICAALNNAYSVGRERSFQLMGSGGNLISMDEKTVQYRRTRFSERPETSWTPETNDPIREEFEELAQCRLSGKRPETDGRVGAQAVAVMDALIRSARQGGSMEIVEAPGESP